MQVVRKTLGELGVTVDCLQHGAVTITCIPEPGNIVWPVRALFASLADDELARAADAAPAGTVDPAAGLMALNFNVYLIETPDFTALVDAGIGNDKERDDRPAWHRRDAPFLETLAALSVTPADVDLVVTSHLHADHVGWNTIRSETGWVPTFPNARYVVPETELANWMERAEQEGARSLLHGAYLDSILPIIESCGYEALPSPGEIAPGLFYQPAPGHTDGMSVVRLVAGEDEVLFLADVVHHPLQMADVDIVSNFCARPDQARATRRRLFREAAMRKQVLAPYHFPVPVFGRVDLDEKGFHYRPLPVDDSKRQTGLLTRRHEQ